MIQCCYITSRRDLHCRFTLTGDIGEIFVSNTVDLLLFNQSPFSLRLQYLTIYKARRYIFIYIYTIYTIFFFFLHDLKIYLLYRNNNNYKNKDILLPSEVY